MSLPAAFWFALRRAFLTIVALALVVVADVVLDGGWPVAVVAVVVVVLLIVSYERRDRAAGPGGPLEPVTERARSAAWWAPLIAGIVLYAALDYDAIVFAVTVVAGSVAALTFVVWWFHRPPRAVSA